METTENIFERINRTALQKRRENASEYAARLERVRLQLHEEARLADDSMDKRRKVNRKK